MKVLPNKEFEKAVVSRGLSRGMSEEDALAEAAGTEAIHLIPEGGILVRRGASSVIRRHEVGHKVLGHTTKYSDIETGAQTIGDDILDEILAEKYSYETGGKELTYRLAIPAINMLIRGYKWSPESAVFWSLHILGKELGVTATKSERRELARHARGSLRRPRRRR